MTSDIRSGYKILTHDWRPPVRGGSPLLVPPYTLPVELPVVSLDTTEAECGAGYNYAETLAKAASIAGFWSSGYPSKCLRVRAGEDAIQRDGKRRSSSLLVERMCSDIEIQSAMRELVASWAGAHTEALVDEQWAWYKALGRPFHDESKVVEGLQTALDRRKLKWTLKRFGAARAARDAWDARAAWAAWDARAAWDAWAAWDARAALSVFSAVACGQSSSPCKADHLTVGIRDAFANGLAIALPTGVNELGYAMCNVELA